MRSAVSPIPKSKHVLRLPHWAQQGLPIGLVLTLAAVLRLYQLSTESVWIDEMLSIDDANNFEFGIPYIRPFYFMLLRGWMQLGSSDAWLRGLSVLFGLGTVWFTYQLGCRMIGRSTGVVAAFLASISPLFINHSQEIRMYSLISFLSIGGTLALSRAFEKPTYTSLGWWVLARIALLLTNSNNVLLLLPDMVLAGWQFWHKRRWLLSFALGLGTIGVFFLPPLYVLLWGGASADFMENQVGDYSKPGLTQIVGMLTQFTVYWPIRHLLESQQLELSNNQLSDASLVSKVLSTQAFVLFFYAGVTLVLLGLLGISLLALRDRQRSERLSWLVIWALLPAAAMLGVSYLKSSIWFPRYLMFIAPYFLILLAMGFMVLWHWRRQVAIAVALILLIAVGGGLKDYYGTLYRNDWQGVAQLVSRNEQPNDVVVFYSIPRLFEQSFPRYYDGSAPVYLVNRNLQELKQVPPATSRLWLVCWIFCPEQQGLETIMKTVVDDDFQIQQETAFRSLENHPIKVFLVE